jgi:NADPH:quinone reductase-like Zn-dependent oxidoreductase
MKAYSGMSFGRSARFALIASVALFSASVGQNSAAQETIRQYQIENGELVIRTVPRPTPGANEVLVRVRAVSLNRRELMVLEGTYGAGGTNAAVPLSDGAGEVIAVGANVARLRVGDRVASTFFVNWSDGESPQGLQARGGDVDGMLSEMIVSSEDALVKIPDYMTYEEAATLPCAGLTAFNALFKLADLQPDEYVLLEGTGGVSIFGLQFAVAVGARAIITSSSDEKIERALELGAFGTVNYRTVPEWQHDVRRLTGDVGVDHVLEVGGRDTLPRAVQALGNGGHITIIGGLSGFGGRVPADALAAANGRISQIYVGSRDDFEAMNAFLEKHELHPLIDHVFSFEEAPAAFEFMDDSLHFGKIVIAL